MISSRLGLRVPEHVQLRAPSLRLCRDVSAAQVALCALRPVVDLRSGVGQRGADVRAAHSSKHCGPEHLLRPDEHVRGPPHAHTWPVRAVLGSLLWPSCVLFRICPPRVFFACVCAVCMCVVCARMRLCVSYDNVRTHAFDGTHTRAHNTQALLVKTITNATANANAILGVEIADTVVTFLSIPDVDKEVCFLFCPCARGCVPLIIKIVVTVLNPLPLGWTRSKH